MTFKLNRLCLGLLPLLAAPAVEAADIAREIHQPGPGAGGFAEISFGLRTEKLPLIGFNDRDVEDSADMINGIVIAIEGRFQYKRFFAEFLADSFNDVTLGYTVLESDQFSLDLVGTQLFSVVERDNLEAFESIEDRDGDFNLGLRGIWYNGDNLMQMEMVRDASHAHNGVIVSAQFGRQYQFRNWNLHTLAGVRYFSENVVDYYFGVSEQESTASLQAYNGSDGFMPTAQIGATIPLNEKWLFRASANYSYLPESVRDSPMAQGDELYHVRMGFHRVLYPW